MCRLRHSQAERDVGAAPYLLRVYAESILAGMSVPLTLLGLLEREPSRARP